MKQDGYDPELIHACHNRTVVIDAHFGERENKQINVVEAHGLRNVHLYEGDEPWINIRDAVGDLTKKFLCLNEVYPGRLHDSAPVHRREHHSPADREDAHLHDDDRRDEERVRRAAERAPALDASGDPRDARRPADDPEEDPPRRVRGDGRHVRRRRPGTALHGAAREERHPGERRSGRDRRRRREADGHGPDVDQVHPAGARPRARDCGDPREIEIVGDEEAGARELALRRAVPQDDVRVADAAQDLLGSAEEADRVVAEDRARAVGVHRERGLSRQLLVSGQGEGDDGVRAREPVGPAVPALGAGDAPTRSGYPTIPEEGATIKRTGWRALGKSIGILATVRQGSARVWATAEAAGGK